MAVEDEVDVDGVEEEDVVEEDKTSLVIFLGTLLFHVLFVHVSMS